MQHYRHLLRIARQAHANGRVDQAIIYAKKALEVNRAGATAHQLLGTWLLSRGRKRRALAHFREYLKLRPGAADAVQIRKLLKALDR